VVTVFSCMLPDDDFPVVLHSVTTPPRGLNELSGVGVFPGAFNPLHFGHRSLRRIAEKILAQDVVYELSVANVEKSSLTEDDIRLRLQQFDDSSIAVTAAPRFVDKAALFRRCCFVVGVDTAERIVRPSFYNGRLDEMHSALQQLLDMGNRFLVGGRLCRRAGTARFLGVDDLQIPERFQELFVGVPESLFREDISSTELRRNS
jgi:hypothetical protein